MESAAIHSSEVHEVDSGIPMTLFKGFSTSLSLLQGELHLSHQAFLLRRKDVTAGGIAVYSLQLIVYSLRLISWLFADNLQISC